MGRIARTFARVWNSSRTPAARPVARPQFEGLEDRMLMYGTPLPDGISFSNGTVRIVGGDANDSAAVVMEGGQVKASLSHTVYIQVDINTTITQVIRDPDRFYDPATVTRVYFVGRGGNDWFRNDTGIRSDAIGNEGFDNLVGGWGDDHLLGSDDGDSLEGRGGNDELEGGLGGDAYVFSGRNLGGDTVVEAANLDADELDLTNFGKINIRGGGVRPLTTGATIDLARTTAQTVNSGNLTLTFSDAAGIENVRGTVRGDMVKGNARNNRVYGYGGNDNLQGFAGNDVLYGGDGNDSIDGGVGNDGVYGENDADNIRGGAGDDTVSAGSGNDQARGDSGNDYLYGGFGDDVVRGDAGSDHLNGDGGNDTLYGSLDGRSWVNGGDGDDTLITVGNATDDALSGGAGFDSFWCDAPATEAISDVSSAENNAGHVHRIGGYYACTIDDGSSVRHLGAPGLSRNGAALADPVMEEDDSGTLVNFAGNPLFSGAGPSRDDIDQGGVGDCYFVAALSAIAGTNPDVIRQTVADLGDGTYAVNFHGVFGIDVFVRVDADLWASGTTPIYANLGAENSLWAAVVEKAYAFYKDAKGNYGSINGGNGDGWTPAQALGLASSGFETELFANATLLVSAMRAQWLAGKAITVGGPAPFHSNTVKDDYDNPMTDADENTRRRGAHVYTLVSVASDLSSVTLRNPWADDGTGSTDADPNDGYVTIPAGLLFYCSGGFRTYTV
jgi:Ca2+-binding RTX toxin-like protein